MKITFSILISLSLVCSARAEEEFKLLSTEDYEPQMGLAIPVGIAVLAAGATGIIVMLHFCKKWFGTNQPPANTTNEFKVHRSDGRGAWAQVGAVTNTFEKFKWSETNSVNDAGYFYRLSYDPAIEL